MKSFSKLIFIVSVPFLVSCSWSDFHPEGHFGLKLRNESDRQIYYERIITDSTYYGGSDLYRECFKSISPFYHSTRGIINPGEKGYYYGGSIRNIGDAKYRPPCEERLKTEGPIYLGIFYPHVGVLGDEDCVGVFKLTYEVLDTLLHWEASFPFPEEVERFTIEEFREYSGYEYFTKIPPVYWGHEYDGYRPEDLVQGE